MQANGKNTFVQEVSIMALFVGHENFAQLIGFQEDNLTIYMLYYSLGSLNGWINKNNPKKHVFQIIHSLSKALATLHSCGIVHNDM